MTKQVARLYSLVVGVVVFFVAWAAVAAHPWQTAAAVDPRLAALTARRQAVQKLSAQVKQTLDRRFAAYRVALAKRNAALARLTAAAPAASAQAVSAQPAPATPAAAPSVRVVTLPPLIITKTS
ncbi:MAG TPA: hypothetical protein VNC40_04930 [Gaiellaceae bacterium]|nr:hypothetical protein [Gaiellaceae bacterium]